MSSVNNLASEMQRMGLDGSQASRFHEVTIEYPVLDLLDSEDATSLKLLAPEYSGFRAEPDIQNFSLAVSGTDFVVRLPLREAGNSSTTAKLRIPELFAMMSTLDTVPGRSVLQAVTFSDARGLFVYRFQLTTKAPGSPHVVRSVDLKAHEWALVAISCQSFPWFQLLRNLIGRASDRAYLHVHERLQNYRWYSKQHEQEDWSWDELPNANQLVAWNLVAIRKTRHGKKRKAVKNIQSLPDREQDFALPCAHEQLIYVPMLKTMSRELCKTFCCQICEEPVMQEEDLWRLQRFVEREQRDTFAMKEQLWKQLDATVTMDARPLHMHSMFLGMAVEHAFESIKVPECVSPAALNFANSKEAEAIMYAVKQVIGKSNAVFDCTPMLVLVSLTSVRDKAVAGFAKSAAGVAATLPADWERMSMVWLMRAVKLASVQGYDGRDISAAFGAEGGRDEDVEERRKAVDDLAALMENSGGLERRKTHL